MGCARAHVCVTWDFPAHGCLRDSPLQYYHVPASKQSQRTERVIHLTVHTCALCIYRKYRTDTYSAERRGRTARKTREYVRTASTRGPTLCTRRESMRVQVRKSTVVRWGEGGSVKKEEREMAKSKTEFVFGKARGGWLSAYLLITSLFRVFLVRMFSLYAYYIRERMGIRMIFDLLCIFHSERRVPLSSSFWRLCKSCTFHLLLLS